MASGSDKKRLFWFKYEWLSHYGLQITAHDPKSSKVISMKCRFCEFGRDGVDGGEERKRKITKHIKFYKKPWRLDNTYDKYTTISVEEKKEYFKKIEYSRPLASMIRNDRSSTIDKEMLVFNISKDILLK